MKKIFAISMIMLLPCLADAQAVSSKEILPAKDLVAGYMAKAARLTDYYLRTDDAIVTDKSYEGRSRQARNALLQLAVSFCEERGNQYSNPDIKYFFKKLALKGNDSVKMKAEPGQQFTGIPAMDSFSIVNYGDSVLVITGKNKTEIVRDIEVKAKYKDEKVCKLLQEDVELLLKELAKTGVNLTPEELKQCPDCIRDK